jgi:hypothetical protein
MKRSKRVAVIAVLVLTGIALVAAPAVARRGRDAGWHRGAGRGAGPAFTQEQLERIESIHEKYSDRQAELTNRLKVIVVEARDKMGEGAPDFNAIERTMEEVADIRLQLAKIRLSIHKEIRPLLDDDQKVLFDRGLGRMLHGGMGAGGGNMGGHCGMTQGQRMQGRPGRGMGMGRAEGRGMGRGMGPGMGQGMGMGRGGEMMPWCPFADEVEDEGPDDD